MLQTKGTHLRTKYGQYVIAYASYALSLEKQYEIGPLKK